MIDSSWKNPSRCYNIPIFMGKISAKTHKFVRGNAHRDHKCLYWSTLKVFKQRLTKECNEDLRIHTANYIRNNEEIHHAILYGDTSYRTVDEYCSAIEQGTLWGGDPELQALSNIYNTIIYLISMREDNGKKSVWSKIYGENNSLVKTFVCILYDEQQRHYDPLYVVNIENENEQETIFERNDDTVKELLTNFIREDLKCDGNVRLDFMTNIDVNEVPSIGNDLNDAARVSELVLQNQPTKRKLDEHDMIKLGQDNERQLPIEISKEYYVSNKRIKSAEDASGQILKRCGNDMNSINIKELAQTDMFNDMTSSLVHKESTTECSKISNNEHDKEKKDDKKVLAKQMDDDDKKILAKQMDDDKQNYDSKSSI
ncbi:unnamed protein product [Rotaria sordida]|uniref:Ubiquitin thioesterase OTU n=2 Tax=Rotaria sordida TaxID=392033 RepID=A0A818YNT8_9BILA|nr:unnamed protein product [Rotaria sordida]